MRTSARMAHGPGPLAAPSDCQILNWHPALQLDFSEEISDSIQVKMGCPEQNALNLFLGGKPDLEGTLVL